MITLRCELRLCPDSPNINTTTSSKLLGFRPCGRRYITYLHVCVLFLRYSFVAHLILSSISDQSLSIRRPGYEGRCYTITLVVGAYFDSPVLPNRHTAASRKKYQPQSRRHCGQRSSILQPLVHSFCRHTQDSRSINAERQTLQPEPIHYPGRDSMCLMRNALASHRYRWCTGCRELCRGRLIPTRGFTRARSGQERWIIRGRTQPAVVAIGSLDSTYVR